MARPVQERCGLCGFQKPDPAVLPRSPHWLYGTKASGEPKISEGSCIHCRYIVYKQLKTSFSALKTTGREVELEKAVRESKKRRLVTSMAAKLKQRPESSSFVNRAGSCVKMLKKSATV